MIGEIVKGTENELKNIINKALKKTSKNELSHHDLKIKTKVLILQNVLSKITEYAKNNKFDLIAINSHQKNMLKRMFLGSVTEQVVKSSSCNVL